MGIPFREGPHIMSRALTEVRRRFPDMEIRLAAISDEDGPDAVHRDQLDMAIVSRYGIAPEGQRPGRGCASGPSGTTRCGSASPWTTRWPALPAAP